MSNLAVGLRKESLVPTARQHQNAFRCVGHIEHDLEQGVTAKITLRIDFLNYPFKRQILVRVCVQTHFSDSLQ